MGLPCTRGTEGGVCVCVRGRETKEKAGASSAVYDFPHRGWTGGEVSLPASPAATASTPLPPSTPSLPQNAATRTTGAGAVARVGPSMGSAAAAAAAKGKKNASAAGGGAK